MMRVFIYSEQASYQPISWKILIYLFTKTPLASLFLSTFITSLGLVFPTRLSPQSFYVTQTAGTSQLCIHFNLVSLFCLV